jgi:hypothetical protein
MTKTSSPQPDPQQPLKSVDQQKAAPMMVIGGLEPLLPLTQTGVLQLQRMIGNQGAQRVIASRRLIQRADATAVPAKTDEGLTGQGAVDGFAQKIYTFINKPENAEATVTQLRDTLEQAANDELVAIAPDVPHVAYSFADAGGNRAWFVSGDWQVEINADNVFGGEKVKIKDLSTDDLTNAISTAYHEGRHAEQYFRIAQLFAEDLARARVPATDIKKAMQKHLNGLPESVLDSAIAHPLGANLDPAIREKIRLWTTSLYGAGTHYRDVVYTMYDEAISGLHNNIQALLAIVPDDFAQLPQDQQTAIAQQVSTCKPAIETHVYRLRQYQINQLQPEIDRLQAMPITSPNDNTMLMLGHLMQLTRAINTIVILMPVSSEPAKAREMGVKVNSHIEAMQEELRLADYQLPEQSDAVEAEEKVEEAFEKLMKKQ